MNSWLIYGHLHSTPFEAASLVETHFRLLAVKDNFVTSICPSYFHETLDQSLAEALTSHLATHYNVLDMASLIHVINSVTYHSTISDKLFLENDAPCADDLTLPQVLNHDDLVCVKLTGEELVKAALELLNRVVTASRQLAEDARKVLGVVSPLEVAETELVGRVLLKDQHRRV